MRQLKEKPTRKRVGFLSSGAPARAGVKILDDDGNEIGVVTSGCPAPSIKGLSPYYHTVSTILTLPRIHSFTHPWTPLVVQEWIY